MYYIWHKLPSKHRPDKHVRGICVSPYVGPYSYGELNCDGLHIIITFIYIILHCLHPRIKLNPCWHGPPLVVQIFHWHECCLGQYNTFKRWTHADAPFVRRHLHKSNKAVSIVRYLVTLCRRVVSDPWRQPCQLLSISLYLWRLVWCRWWWLRSYTHWVCPAIFVLVFLYFSLHSFSRASRHRPSHLLSTRAQSSLM